MTLTGHRGGKVRYTIARFAFVLILIPLLLGCELKPEDKWPVIAGEAVNADFTIKLTMSEDLGIMQFSVAKDHVDVTLDIRSYNANQGYDVKVILTDIVKCPGGSLGMTGTARFEDLIGTYIDGKPPQGVSRIGFTFYPPWFPLSLADWFDGVNITNGYTYFFIVIIEDMDGRTDSWEFQVSCTLAL